ncbi:MAG TPA: hypothetical protein VGC80_00580, partial [Acetobacteraceae bacterium]
MVISRETDRTQGPSLQPAEASAAALVDPVGPTATGLDPEAIFAAIGEVPYRWLIDSDALAWGPNAHQVLAPLAPAGLASGNSYAGLIDPPGGPARSEAIMRCGLHDEGAGVA